MPGDFPGGPVVRTPSFHCRGRGFDPWSGNWDPAGCAAKKKMHAWHDPMMGSVILHHASLESGFQKCLWWYVRLQTFGCLSTFLLLLFLKSIYLFRLCRVLVAACGTFLAAWGFLVAACGLLSCSMHAGSRSPTRDQTRAPCIGSTESYPLDHQGSPSSYFFTFSILVFFYYKIHGAITISNENKLCHC